ncbi:hypothetical protein [Thermofilum pendens]|uniref:Uncharacterized protein n=1 Tax=Thermofilum pendens (strain DSM 2475 / Hrk 5) TaxID=368408 RepID=A1S1C5_THEPD|nr:hypothetical protein [Thermofilum pendens]ABL79255.1 hypothetical protein Tpen_1860 [Thermofilum pendens Hrk 5]
MSEKKCEVMSFGEWVQLYGGGVREYFEYLVLEMVRQRGEVSLTAIMDELRRQADGDKRVRAWYTPQRVVTLLAIMAKQGKIRLKLVGSKRVVEDGRRGA